MLEALDEGVVAEQLNCVPGKAGLKGIEYCSHLVNEGVHRAGSRREFTSLPTGIVRVTGPIESRYECRYSGW